MILPNMPEALSNPEYKKELQALADWAASLWQRPLHGTFTDHGVSHSHTILKISGKLLLPLSVPLTALERFLYISAAYLHDIGMQRHPDRIDAEDEAYTSKDLALMRDVHHDTSYQMIISLAHTVVPHLYRGLIEWIAVISRFHRTRGCDLASLSDGSINGETVRIPLLAALLRIADELDASNGRAGLGSVSFDALPAVSKYHWWGHEYVQSIDIKAGKVTLRFCLPLKHRGSRALEALREKSVSAIRSRYDNVYDTLYDYGLCLYRDVLEDVYYSEQQHDIPSDLYAYIDAMLDNQTLEMDYRFVPHGAKASAEAEDEALRVRGGRIFVDVGQDLCSGILDTHQISDGILWEGRRCKSTVAAIMQNPCFVLHNADASARRVEIVAHRYPDFDCFAAAYLVACLLEKGCLPPCADQLLTYVEEIEQGTMRLGSNHHAAFSIAHALFPVLEKAHPGTDVDAAVMRKGVSLVRRMMAYAEKGGSLYDFTVTEDADFAQEVVWIDKDAEKYRYDRNGSFMDDDGNAMPICEKRLVHIPTQEGGTEAVNGLFWHRTPHPLLHKYWAREDAEQFIFTAIPLFENKLVTCGSLRVPTCRVILSVIPTSNCTLLKLGEALEEAELAREKEIFGKDVSQWRSRKHIRAGFPHASNADPWYTGLHHGYTIVDAPGVGSLLTVKDIEAVTLRLLASAP